MVRQNIVFFTGAGISAESGIPSVPYKKSTPRPTLQNYYDKSNTFPKFAH